MYGAHLSPVHIQRAVRFTVHICRTGPDGQSAYRWTGPTVLEHVQKLRTVRLTGFYSAPT